MCVIQSESDKGRWRERESVCIFVFLSPSLFQILVPSFYFVIEKVFVYEYKREPTLMSIHTHIYIHMYVSCVID